MVGRGEKERVIGTCGACGSVYAVRRQPDGGLLPIGKRNGCECGAAEFVPVESDEADGET